MSNVDPARSEMWRAIQDRVWQAAKSGAELFAQNVAFGIEAAVAHGHYESPIEAIFAAWWESLRAAQGMAWADLCVQREVTVSGQVYRPDFIVVMDIHPGSYGANVFTDYPRIAIELDGHDFHERTREQVTYRNARDRALQSAGWKVLHISGSELYRQPEECVTGILDIVRNEWQEFWRRYWADVNKKTAERAADLETGALTARES
jgi:very-short-patch-repair endonuclease